LVPPAALAEGLSRVQWPGRLDLRQLPDGREVLLDAACNVDGAAALAAFLNILPLETTVGVRVMRDKAVDDMLRDLAKRSAPSSLPVHRIPAPRATHLAHRAQSIAPWLPVGWNPRQPGR
jgi:folylpolyglutamate synthase/dihydropteroate synthase